MRLALTAKLTPVLFLLGCRAVPAPEPPMDASLSPAVEVAEPAAAAPLPLESPTVTLKRDLCQRALDRHNRAYASDQAATPPKCALVNVREVADKTYVVALYRGSEDWRADGSKAGDVGMMTEGDTDTFAMDFEHCEPFEYWLASVDAGRLSKAQVLTEICNDGHGAAGVGEDSVTVSADAIVIRTNGGSNWRWGHEGRFSLPDLKRLSDVFDGSWVVSTNAERSQWSWTDRLGANAWSAPRCRSGKVEPPAEELTYALVPAYDAAPALAGDAWKTAKSITGCATTLDGDSGQRLAGTAAADSARLSLFVAEDQLFIEVNDDKLVTSGKLQDELEVWHRQEPSGDWSVQCLEEAAPATGTAIRMGDLSTRLVGDKTGPALKVERAPAKDGAPPRLRVSLPTGTHAVTVVYRDTDDGKQHGLVLGSSLFDPKDDVTLAVLHPIDPKTATCELVDGSLALQMKPQTDPDVPITRF